MLEMAEYNDKAGLTSAAVGKSGLAPLTLGLMIPELALTSRSTWLAWTTTSQCTGSSSRQATYRSTHMSQRDRKFWTGRPGDVTGSLETYDSVVVRKLPLPLPGKVSC